MEIKGERLSSPLLLYGENQGSSTNAGVVVNVSDGDLGCRQGEDASRASITPALVLATSVVVSGSYVYGSAVGYSSPTQSGIMHDLGLTVAEYSFFGSALTIGAMIGALVSGRFADCMGRRGAMGFSQIFCLLGWLALGLSKVVWLLDLGRLFLGFGMGLLSYLLPVYITEITPKDLRGGVSAFQQLMIGFGGSVTYLIGAFLNWRALALIGTIPCLVQLFGLFFIPESPRWLATVGQRKELQSALQRLRGKNVDVSDEVAEIRDYTETLQLESKARFLDLFQWRYSRSLIVGVGLMVLQQFGGSIAVSFYANSIFASAGLSAIIGATAMMASQLPVAGLSVLLMDKSGRRPLLLVSACGSCLGCLLLGLAFFFQDLENWKEVTPLWALVGFLVFTGSFALGMGSIPWVIMSEIFPINMKGAAGSLVTFVCWFFSWIVSFSFNFLMSWSPSGTFFIFSGMNGLTVLFIAKLVPETKGRTLEEIQASLNESIFNGQINSVKSKNENKSSDICVR